MSDVALTPERTRELERATNGGPHLGMGLDDPEQAMRLIAERFGAWDQDLAAAIAEADREADRLREVRGRLQQMARYATPNSVREADHAVT